ncbi:MAG: SDR family NAD(P)-dependent oxidoreductase [Armatimonadota bacterium]
MELEGRTALVTGGTSDIGAAIVRALARRGADVAIHYHRNVTKAQAISAEISALGRQARVIQGDLAFAPDARRVAVEAGAFAPVDILVNNAGTPIRRVHWMDLDAAFLDSVFGLNYRAPLYLCQQLTPPMIRRGTGVVINILSTAANLGGTDTVFAYSSAKGALLTLTRALARTLAPQGVRVLAVSPGTIDTEFQRTLTSPEQLEQLRSGIPLGRIGRPEEIGDVVGFLATDAASFIIGETIHVNGGLYMTG